MLFSIIITVYLSIYIRLKDRNFWLENKEFFFYNGTPIYSEFDSFFFARLAEDIKNGNFSLGKPDTLRMFPESHKKAKLKNNEKIYPEYQISGHLPSFLVYIIGKITGAPAESITWHLVYILSTLTIIPFVIYGITTGYIWAGIIGSLVAVSSPMFLARTNLMRLDHDMLNLFFPFLISTLSFLLVREDSSKNRVKYAILTSVSILLYQLWYGHSNVILVMIITLIIGDLITKKRFKREYFIHWLIVILPQLWYLYEAPYYLYLQFTTLVLKINVKTSADKIFREFPNVLISISELQKMTVGEILSTMILNKVLSGIGLVGFVLFTLLNFKKAIFLLPTFAIGLVSFTSGARFVMYLAPFSGIGLGFLMELILQKLLSQDKIKENLFKALAGFAMVVILFFIQLDTSKFIISTPKADAKTVNDMVWIRENTPLNSVIWTWWDHGYTFQMYSRRATIHDGGSQISPKTYFVAKSFSTDNPEEAWLFTSFVVNYGLDDLANMILSGKRAKDIVEAIRTGNFKKPIKVPVYWVFTRDLIEKFGWINFFGTFDFDTKNGTFGRIIIPKTCKGIERDKIFCEDIGIQINFDRGNIITPHGSIPIGKLIVKNENEKKEFNLNDESPIVVEIADAKSNLKVLAITQKKEARSMFNRMFILRDYDPRFFELVLDDFPHMVVYRVKESY